MATRRMLSGVLSASPLPVSLALALLVASGCPEPQGDDDDGDDVVVQAIGGVTVQTDPAFASLSAAFLDVTGGDECETTEVAGCTVVNCANVVDPVQARFMNAGTINYTAGDGAGSIAHTLEFDNGYTAITPDPVEPMFDNTNEVREELVVDAAGGSDVPAFTLTVTAPRVIQLVEPPLSSVNVDRIDGINVSWEILGGAPGEIEAVYVDRPFTRSATCRFAIADGSGAIPAQVLGDFSSAEGELQIQVVSEAETQVDDASSVLFRAFTHARSAVGDVAVYNVFFTG